MMCEEIIGLIIEDEEIVAEIDDEEEITASIELPAAIETDPYTGPYVFTPDDTSQIISIADLKAIEDIIINPIPQNYGLITYDGSGIRVS